MIEQVRDNMPSGNMRTKYWIDKTRGQFDHWFTTVDDLTGQIIEIVEYYESIDIKLTNRQLYYQLVGKDLIPNYMEVYKRICVFLTDMRYCGLIDWNSIEDLARVPKRPSQWESISDLIKSATQQYRLPRWNGQQYYLEMYCEKEAGVNVLSTVARKYHIHFGYNKGYSSAAAMYGLSKRIQEQIHDGKEVKILYFGDHDASGLDMIRDITDRTEEFLTEGDNYTDPDFEIVPVSLTMDQIKLYNPPANPAKMTDPRAKWYIERFGKVSWELDAIDALELRTIAEKSILEYIDMDEFNSWIKREKKESKTLKKFGKSIK